MIRSNFIFHTEKIMIAAGLTFILAGPISAQDNSKKKPTPAPAPAPAAKPPVAPPRPAQGSSGGTHPSSSTGAANSSTTPAPHGSTIGATNGAVTNNAGASRHITITSATNTPTQVKPPTSVDHGLIAPKVPVGVKEVRLAGGGAVRMRTGGQPAEIRDPRRGMDIHHNLAGGRRVSVERADHSRLVYERGRPGYIGHPYLYRGHEFARRTYYFNGRAYDRFYNPYSFRGVRLEVYTPARFYPVGFYGWAYTRWPGAVLYTWGFAGSPWYGYYGAYFSPFAVYPLPSLWLTDYVISTSLEKGYEAELAVGPPPSMADASPITPEVKQLVSAEVQRQIALENAEAQQNAANQQIDASSSSIARQLTDNQPHAFVAGKEMDVVDFQGRECAITDGDVLQLMGPPAPDATDAPLVVMASKGGRECRKSAIVSVPLDELQEMQNHMRETIDLGLAELQSKQGQGGLPSAPPSALTPAVNAAFAQDAPPPDPAGEKDLAAQAQQADQSEQELLAQATRQGGPSDPSIAGSTPPPYASPAIPTAPINISLGQSTARVKELLGEPSRVVNLGTKTIYFYKDMKITFLEGKVSGVE